MKKVKPIKRVDPDNVIPLKSFKPHTRIVPLDNVDPKLVELMRTYQKRGTNLIDNLERMKDIQQDKEQREIEQQAEQEMIKEILAERAKLPKDIAQKIVLGEKFDDTDMDSKPKREILTREEALRRIKEKSKK